jgi:thiamine-phosphate pyrophosphorylase
MRIIVITPEHMVPEELATVNRLFANGLQRLHLRKANYTDAAYTEYLQQIDYQYHNRIVLHSSFQLVERFGLGGIHLNSHCQKDENVRNWARGLVDKVTISGSFHSWEEIRANRFPYTYVFISPVYDSISKADYKADIDLNGAKALKQQLQAEGRHCPEIVGLGGISAAQIEELLEYGFDGAALLGSIWESDDPLKRFVEARGAVS